MCNNDFDMNQVRFIMPLHGFYNQLIQEAGYDIRNPYRGNNLCLRIFREAHFRLNLPFKSIWYNRENVTDKEFIIVYDPLIIPDYMEWLKKKNPQSRIILSYINKVNAKNSPDHFKNEWCVKWTGDTEDSERYGINLYEGIVYFKKYKVNKEVPLYDIFYVGKDKGRLNYLLQLEKSFQSVGLKTYFHIVAGKRWFYRPNKEYKPFMPYSDVLKALGRTRAILHLINGGQDGITFRVMESLIFEIKLITDNRKLMQYDFYNPDNIFVLGVDNIEGLPKFLSKPYVPVQSKWFDVMYFEDAIKIMCIDSFGEK